MKVIYPGTFDPFSLGHLDIACRGARIYEQVIVAVSESSNKSPMFSFVDRINMATAAVENEEKIIVKGFSGLMVDFMAENNILHVLRGIRGMVDFDYEFQMAQANRTMFPGFEPIFLMPGPKYAALSSTFVREIIRLGGNPSRFLPEQVSKYICERRTGG